MMYYSGGNNQVGRFPNYCVDIQTEFYRDATARFGTLLKLHGSINWLFCKTCSRLELGSSASTKYITIMGRVLGDATIEMEKSFLADGSKCPKCGTELRPLLIAPTHLKDYRNPHLAQVWYHAERVLRECDRAILVGYSLPEDDIEVIYLLKRGLAHLSPQQITVVQKDDKRPVLNQSDVGRRYRALFGDVDWHTGNGLNEWLGKP
jgi:NAD-dependent SIR2 family protein deacetylase